MDQEEFDRQSEILKAERRKDILRQASLRDKIQGECSHLKENGKTRLAGQKTSDGSTHYICQCCFKRFVEPDVKAHLRPLEDLVGGDSLVTHEKIDWADLLKQHEEIACVLRDEAILYGVAYGNAKCELDKHEALIRTLKHEAFDGPSKL